LKSEKTESFCEFFIFFAVSGAVQVAAFEFLEHSTVHAFPIMNYVKTE